jgi:hypothetical protein
MDGRKLTSKVSVFLGNSKRVTCKISNTQIHGSNVITMDEDITCGVKIYYKGKEFSFSMGEYPISIFGFLNDYPILYVSGRLIILLLDKLINGEVDSIYKCVKVLGTNEKFCSWIHYNGVIYVETHNSDIWVFHKLQIIEDSYRKEEIKKEEFDIINIKASAQREFMFNNLTSINNTYKK